MPKKVLQTNAYKNLALYSHVHASGTDDLPPDAAYGRVLQRDLRETQNDQVWIRSDISQIGVANELLRHQLQFVQTDNQRLQQLALERERREQEERREWAERAARQRAEEDERLRMQEEWEKVKAADFRRVAAVRRLVEDERRQVAATQRRIDALMQRQHQPARGRFPPTGHLVFVYVMYADGLTAPAGSEYHCQVGFDEGAEQGRTRAYTEGGQPVWNEYVTTMRLPEGAKNLKVTLFDGSREVGEGLLDLRTAENEVTWVDLLDGAAPAGRVHLLFYCQSPYPPPPPPGAGYGSAGGSTLGLKVIQGRDLVDLDVIGKSEPYVKLCWGADTTPFYTTKVSKGRNPVWNEGVTELPVPVGVDHVSLYVFDKDRFSKDDFMGYHRLNLSAAPPGPVWVPLHGRPNHDDHKLLKKHHNDLGELNLHVAYQAAASGAGGTGTCPTRCLVTVTVVDGIHTMEDPFVTVNVGDNQASSGHRINRQWNPTFEVLAPESESFMNFRVFENANLNRESFLGQANYDIRPSLRKNDVYSLPLMPRSSEGYQADHYMNDGSGKIRFKTEWLAAGAPRPAISATPPPPTRPAFTPPVSLPSGGGGGGGARVPRPPSEDAFNYPRAASNSSSGTHYSRDEGRGGSALFNYPT